MWTIANVLGQQVASYETQGSLRISTTSLAEGTYVARFSGAQGAGTIIFIVQR